MVSMLKFTNNINILTYTEDYSFFLNILCDNEL